MLTCRICKTALPREMFHKDATRKTGVRSVCKTCDHARAAAWQRSHKEHMKAYRAKYRQDHRQQAAVSSRKSRRKHRAACLVKAAKDRAAVKGVPFDLDAHVATIQMILDAGVCQMTGLPFDLDARREWNSPSLDRIVPDAGYVMSNVRVVCHGMNCALGTWGEDALRTMAVAWLNKR